MKRLTLIIFILLLGGCYNYKELNDLAIISGMGIDKDNDNFILTIQIINTEKDGILSDSSQTKFITYKGEGKTLEEAYRNIIKNMPKQIYPDSMQIIVINEDVLSNLDDILDMFFRKTEFDKQFYTLISKDKANDILNVVTNIEQINSKKIKDGLILNSNYLGTSRIVTYEDILMKYLNNKIDIAIPSIYIENNSNESNNLNNIEKTDNNTSLKLGRIAIFEKNKLVGYLSNEESIDYNILTNNISNTIISIPYNNGYTILELNNIKSNIKLIKNTNNIDIKIKANASIAEITSDIDLENISEFNKINILANQYLENRILSTLETLKKYNSDILGIEDLYYKRNNAYYKKMDFYLSNINININSNINVSSKGNTIKVIKNENQ